jgi:hypothetical protein
MFKYLENHDIQGNVNKVQKVSVAPAAFLRNTLHSYHFVGKLEHAAVRYCPINC